MASLSGTAGSPWQEAETHFTAFLIASPSGITLVTMCVLHNVHWDSCSVTGFRDRSRLTIRSQQWSKCGFDCASKLRAFHSPFTAVGPAVDLLAYRSRSRFTAHCSLLTAHCS